MNNRLQLLLTECTDEQKKTNKLLEKIAALLVAQQILQESIDHRGEPRDQETITELISESFSAGLCLLSHLEQRNKQFEYQQQEFFVENNEQKPGENSLGSF